jgi:hypothetical protein
LEEIAMFKARHSMSSGHLGPPVFLLVSVAAILSAIPAIAQDRAFGPDSYYIDNTPTLSTATSSTITGSAGPGLIITGSFTSNFNTNFGANAAAAQAAWNAAAQVFMNNFSDPIHINITVDAVAGTSVFGQSNWGLIRYTSNSYTNLRNRVVADATTADDNTAIGAGGSVTAADPSGGAGTWWVTRAEAKALGVISDDSSNDGTTTFGAGNPFTFSGPIVGGTYDFQGICAHEISEVMGRDGLKGGTISGLSPSYSLLDDFSYTGTNSKLIAGGANCSFSIDAGTTLLKTFNNYLSNGLDSRDWASGTNDSFNQFSSSGVVNSVTPVDLREMDVIGYNRVVPEPSTSAILVAAAIGMAGYRLRGRLSR